MIPECSVIIPVFNKWELTRSCLVSLCDTSREHDLEVIVVDNGSTDATSSELIPLGKRLFHDRFSALVFSENKNFGPACNAGALHATAPLLFFLNNDTILTQSWGGPLFRAMSGTGISDAVGPLLLFEDDTVQHLGVAVGAREVSHLYQGFPAAHPVVAHKRPLQFLSGAAMMLSRNFFLEVGGFYEGFRNGFEDIDLCVRITAQGGQLHCLPASRVYHLESRTQGRKDNDHHNSRLLNERCGKDIHTDLHRHALNDGFFPKLNDLLEISVCMRPSEEAALSRSARLLPPREWLRLAEENPLWIHGREVLAERLERAKAYDEAALLRLAAAEICPTLERYAALLRLAPLVADASWVDTVSRKLEIMHQYRVETPRMCEVFPRLASQGDSFLEAAFTDKMLEWKAPARH